MGNAIKRLAEIFKRLHNFLYTNSNIPRAERLEAEVIRLLFRKIYDTQQSIGKRLRGTFAHSFYDKRDRNALSS